MISSTKQVTALIIVSKDKFLKRATTSLVQVSSSSLRLLYRVHCNMWGFLLQSMSPCLTLFQMIYSSKESQLRWLKPLLPLWVDCPVFTAIGDVIYYKLVTLFIVSNNKFVKRFTSPLAEVSSSSLRWFYRVHWHMWVFLSPRLSLFLMINSPKESLLRCLKSLRLLWGDCPEFTIIRLPLHCC